MVDERLEDIAYILVRTSKLYEELCIDDAEQLKELFKMYDNWKDIFDRTNIIESYGQGDFHWFIQEKDAYYVDKDDIETQGDIEYNFIGFCVMVDTCIEFIWLNDEHKGKGLGRKMVELSGAEYYDFAINDSLGFWEKVGIPSMWIEDKDGVNHLRSNFKESE